MYKIYHNSRCSKSRAGLTYLKDKSVNFQTIEYLKTGLKMEHLDEILLKTNLKPLDLIRTHEDLYKKELKGKNFTDQEWKKIIIDNPRLLKRPIVIKDKKACHAVPAEMIDDL